MRHLNQSRLGAVTALMVLLGVASMPAAVGVEPPPAITIRVEKSNLLDLVNVGSALIAVGERGLIARSGDGGQTWTSRLSPTSRTLTSIAFDADGVGVAVGHGGTILRTDDVGQTWAPVALKEAGRDAILGVSALKNGQFVAWGAFGMYLVSADLGKTWVRRPVIADDFERHISKVIEAQDAMYMVGETGFVARSADGGQHWTQLKTPYEGSYFGILELKFGTLLAFGMRGNLYRSDDRGATWEKVPLDTHSTINGGSVAADGRVVLAGNRGLLAVSNDEGRSFALMNSPEGTSLTQARLLPDGQLVYTGAMATGRLSAERVAAAGSAHASRVANATPSAPTEAATK